MVVLGCNSESILIVTWCKSSKGNVNRAIDPSVCCQKTLFCDEWERTRDERSFAVTNGQPTGVQPLRFFNIFLGNWRETGMEKSK